MWPPLATGLLAGVAPVAMALGAILCRMAEHAILLDPRPMISGRDRALVEALSVAGQVLLIGAGVSLAMLWGSR